MKFGLISQYLQLLQREALAFPHSRVVFECRAPDDRAEETSDRAWGNGGGFFQPLESPRFLLPRLVEPRLHPTLPVLLEVRVRDHPIALGSHVGLLQKKAHNSHNTRTQQHRQLKTETAESLVTSRLLPISRRNSGRNDRSRYPQRTSSPKKLERKGTTCYRSIFHVIKTAHSRPACSLVPRPRLLQRRNRVRSLLAKSSVLVTFRGGICAYQSDSSIRNYSHICHARARDL